MRSRNGKLKTFDLNGRVGSTPTFGTNYLVRLGYFNNPDGDWGGVERAELSCPHNLYHWLWGQLNSTRYGGSSTPLILFAENIGITLTLTRWMHVPCNYEHSNVSQIF